jgi:hypothetical protein
MSPIVLILIGLLGLFATSGAFVLSASSSIGRFQRPLQSRPKIDLLTLNLAKNPVSSKPTFFKIEPSKGSTIDITINAPIPVKRFNFEMAVLESLQSTTLFKTMFRIVVPWVTDYFKKLFNKPEAKKAEECKLRHVILPLLMLSTNPPHIFTSTTYSYRGGLRCLCEGLC